MYGGDAASERRMLLTSAGRLWTNTHGWMDEAFAPLSHVHSYLPLSGGTLTGPTYISTGGNYPLQLISTQRYMLQIRNSNNSVNAGYGWWLGTDTNFDFIMHADGLGDRLTLGRSNNVMTLGGNTVLHAGNYTSYSPSLGGSGASGTWSINVTGSSSTSSQTYRGIIEDTRAGLRSPNAYDDYRTHWEFTTQIVGGDWHTAMTMQGWHDGYAAWQIIGPASTSAHENFYLRSGINTSWNSVRTILHNGNIGSYALSISGGTTTGVVNITGNGNTGSNNNVGLNVYSTGGNGANMAFHRSGQYAINMGLDSDNVFRIGGWSASANLFQMDMSGNLTMANNVTAYSDERLKKDWAALPSDFVERLAKIKAGTYTRIDREERQAGVSAQDFQKLLPETVLADNEGTLSLAYGNAALVSAVELAKDNIELRARIERLESLINKLIGD
jgi:hypothetical protein